MSPAEVMAVLKALDMDVTGAPAERKARLRMGLGMEREKMSTEKDGGHETEGSGGSAGSPPKKPAAGVGGVKKPAVTANGVKKPVEGTSVVKKA